MRELTASVEIGASPRRVWEILTDFASYPEWNPFITSASGDLERGATLEIRIEPPDGRAISFAPRVLEAEPERELRWLGRLFLPRVLDGEHTLRIEPIDDERVRFVQSERFSGVLVPLVGGTLEKTRRGFEAMNEALKRRAEGLPAGR